MEQEAREGHLESRPLLSGAIIRGADLSVQTKSVLLAYGGMSMPLVVAIIPIITYLPAFYAQELHVSIGAVGAVFLVARLWDGCADLLVGWLSDRSRSRFGRRKPWVILGAPCLMIATWFLCNPPSGAGLFYLIGWAALFYTAWTAVYIPYLSWGSELTADYVERNRVTSYREAFTMLGNLFFATAPLVLLDSGGSLREVLFLIAMAVLVTTPLATLLLGLFVRDPIATHRADTSLIKGLIMSARDRILMLFIGATLLIYIGEGAINSVVVFAFDLGLQMPGRVFWIIFIIYVSGLAALPVALRLSKHAEKHRLLACALAAKAIGYGAHLWVPMGNFSVVIGLWILVGVSHSFVLVLPTSMLADIIDHGEVTEGERRAGAYVALYNLALKLGMAVGVGLSFGLLGIANFDPHGAQHTASDALHLRLIGFGLPCLLIGFAALLLTRHPITRETQLRLREIIDSRSPVGPTGQFCASRTST